MDTLAPDVGSNPGSFKDFAEARGTDTKDAIARAAFSGALEEFFNKVNEANQATDLGQTPGVL